MNLVTTVLFHIILLWNAVISVSVSTSKGLSHISRHRSFLKSHYTVKDDTKNEKFMVRQVPGDGGCLFHAISAWILFVKHKKHVDFDRKALSLSNKLRSLAVRTLKKNDTLILENEECSYSCDLLEKVAEHYNITSDKYCHQMLHPKTWGGGPEIVALCNHFQCPIHVYKLTHSNDSNNPASLFNTSETKVPEFQLRLEARFGSPTFDDKHPMSLLCADGRYVCVLSATNNDAVVNTTSEQLSNVAIRQVSQHQTRRRDRIGRPLLGSVSLRRRRQPAASGAQRAAEAVSGVPEV